MVTNMLSLLSIRFEFGHIIARIRLILLVLFDLKLLLEALTLYLLEFSLHFFYFVFHALQFVFDGLLINAVIVVRRPHDLLIIWLRLRTLIFIIISDLPWVILDTVKGANEHWFTLLLFLLLLFIRAATMLIALWVSTRSVKFNCLAQLCILT